MSTGRIVASKYCLLHELGRGAMGAVWAAEHLTLRSQVAVKLIDPALAASPEAVQRFQREARAAASLRSPNVVQVLDFGIEDGSPYLVMELLRGESLGERLLRQHRLSPGEVAVVIDQLGRAMMRAHAAGFVHRDLKPDNVFLVEEAPTFFVKVLDFGIAKSIRATPTESGTHLTQSGALLGTPQYMSPEQAEGRADARSDLWSMAVIAFECVTGRAPFTGESLPALLQAICYAPVPLPSRRAPVPAGFDAWFLRAVARDPSRRFQTAKELVDALLPLLDVPPEQWAGGTTESAEPDLAPTLRVRTFPHAPGDRRAQARIPSSIPAGINRQRDLHHAALIHNASQSGALLVTRMECRPGQRLSLTFEGREDLDGRTISARVVRVRPRAADPLWKFEVGVQFDVPLRAAVVQELQRGESAGGS